MKYLSILLATCVGMILTACSNVLMNTNVGYSSASNTRLTVNCYRSFINRGYGYSIELPDCSKNTWIVFRNLEMDSENPGDDPNIGFASMQEKFFISTLPNTGASNEAINDTAQFAKEIWEENRSMRCGDGINLTSDLGEDMLIDGNSTWRFVIERGCFSWINSEVLFEPTVYLVVASPYSRYLIWYPEADEQAVQKVLATIKFFMPCGINEQPSCAAGLAPSGVHEISR